MNVTNLKAIMPILGKSTIEELGKDLGENGQLK